MNKIIYQKKQHKDYRRLLLEKIKGISNGYISIVKQDNKIVQINICDRIENSSLILSDQAANLTNYHETG
jgi:hypothetical protein